MKKVSLAVALLVISTAVNAQVSLNSNLETNVLGVKTEAATDVNADVKANSTNKLSADAKARQNIREVKDPRAAIRKPNESNRRSDNTTIRSEQRSELNVIRNKNTEDMSGLNSEFRAELNAAKTDSERVQIRRKYQDLRRDARIENRNEIRDVRGDFRSNTNAN